MSSMSDRTQGGYVSTAVLSLIVVAVLLIIALGFGIWAFAERQDYKNNSDQKAAAAAEEAKVAAQAEDAAKYAEEAKNPLKLFVGPSDFGSVMFEYPKTWSGYVVQATNSSGEPLDGYFHPNVVPDIDVQTNAFALRVSIVTEPYSEVLDTYANLVDDGTVTVSPYKLAKVPSVVGSRVEGEIEPEKRGSLVLFPLRNVTLKVWTETDQYLGDFNTIILPSLSFSP